MRRRMKWFHGPALILLLFLNVAGSSRFTPRPDIGMPAGLIPDCPGVMKNVTISQQSMQQFQIVIHRISETGKVVRRNIPIARAARLVLKDKYIDIKNKKTVMLANGFWESSLLPHNQAVANAYARRGYNVFACETLTLLTFIYPKSARLTRILGTKIGEFLATLMANGLSSNNLELVGLSLGAHIVGFAGKTIYSITGKKPSRITGLDPAGPCFRALSPEYKLYKTDAERVDILHTNIDGFGTAETLGHVDIYANGGEYQPSDIPYIPCLIICSHLRAILYWWMAIEHPKKFMSVKCNTIQDARLANCYNNSDINYLGHETNFDMPGIYYLPTNNEFPYYRGKEGLKVENEIYTSVASRINSDDEFEVNK